MIPIRDRALLGRQRFPHAALPVLTGLLAMTLSLPVVAAEARYRVEVLVFRNVGVPAEPDEQDRIRRFHDAFELGEGAPPEVPVVLEKRDGTFANLRVRLDRLANYEPLVQLTWEQTLFDYHPPVRLHDEVVMAEELHFPGNTAYLDLVTAGRGSGWFDAYVHPLYRLDGTAQLRRSRYLHVDLDLEFRLDGPAWEREFPPGGAERLEPGFTWVGDAPQSIEPAVVADVAEPVAEPFELHRLRQSRQVRTDTMQYFDSAYLGAIVRVTPIAADAP